MTTLAAMDGLQMILLGLALIVMGFVFRRSVRNSQRVRSRNPLKEARDRIAKTEQSPASLERKVEVRLYDLGREIEARIQTRTTVLDQLLQEAERKIELMQELLDRIDDPEIANEIESFQRKFRESDGDNFGDRKAA